MKACRFTGIVFRLLAIIALLLALLAGPPAPRAAEAATQLDIPGPPGSGSFGTSVGALPNGNIVVTDPYYDTGEAADVGAVYLYDGATGALISQLTGSTLGDRVGTAARLLDDGYVVLSPYWDNGAITDAGAVTWCDAEAGCAGTVSTANSLTGGTAGDRVGFTPGMSYSFTPLVNGDYAVSSPLWDNGAATDAGAVTLCHATATCAGTVSPANSLVGSSADDQVGVVTALPSGGYVAGTPNWDNGPALDVGAVTWCPATLGCIGPISPANSLTGAADVDAIGSRGITALPNGNYVVASPQWHGGAVNVGAVTWCDGTAGCTGVVSEANSLTGTRGGDGVGAGGVVALANGFYVVSSPGWYNHTTASAGAVTRCDGTTGCAGQVNGGNSLVGTSAYDGVGTRVIALDNGAYVVGSLFWDDGAYADAGAVTWCPASGGCTGPVTAGNSLTGSHQDDQVGWALAALPGGNYAAGSPFWDYGAVQDAGAVTGCDGDAGCTGPISPLSNSLCGSAAGDQIGYGAIVALAGGNYVIASPLWDNGAVPDAGALTWCSGGAGACMGFVSAANSLTGSAAGDLIGVQVAALAGGNYVAGAPYWDSGAIPDAGAATWCPAGGCTGPISTAGSLHGLAAGDRVGLTITALADGKWVAASPYFDNGSAADAGAITLGEGATSGPPSAANSVFGTAPGGGGGMNAVYDAANAQLVVGRPADNIVSLFRGDPTAVHVREVGAGEILGCGWGVAAVGGLVGLVVLFGIRHTLATRD